MMPKLLSYLRLLRIPNVFTAIADIAMGFLFVTHSLVPAGGFFLLVVATCGLYLAGMVLNEVFDVEVDRIERPERPVPSGQVSLSTARLLGFGLLLVGVAAGIVAGLVFHDSSVNGLRSGIVAGLLATCILLYDGGLKKTFMGAVAMGSCRTLNVLLGMSLFPASGPDPTWFTFSAAQWSVAGGIGIFIAGVTWFARTEARTSNRLLLAFGLIVMLLGLGVMASMELLGKETQFSNDVVWPSLLTLLMVAVFRRGILAVANPVPANVQGTVKQAIFSLIVLDASVCLAVRGPMWAIAILLLLVPMVVLGKWVYST